jgi:hypothetical protein
MTPTAPSSAIERAAWNSSGILRIALAVESKIARRFNIVQEPIGIRASV